MVLFCCCFFNFPMCGLFCFFSRREKGVLFVVIFLVFIKSSLLSYIWGFALSREEKKTPVLSSLPNLVFVNLVRTPITLINVPGTTGGTLVIIIIIVRKERERVTQVEFCIWIKKQRETPPKSPARRGNNFFRSAQNSNQSPLWLSRDFLFWLVGSMETRTRIEWPPIRNVQWKE